MAEGQEPVQVGVEVQRVLAMHRKPEGGRMDGIPQPQLALPVTTQQQGEIRVYRMTLPFLPPSKNVFDGWPREWKSSAKKKWKRHIADEVEAQMMPKGKTEIGLAANLVFATNNRRDPQNYANCLWNWVPDALVQCGVLVDDRDGAIQFGSGLGVRLMYDSRTAVPKKRRERTVLSITMRMPA